MSVNKPGESLLRLVVAVRDGDRLVEIEMIASRPDEADIESLLDSSLKELEALLPRLLASGPELRRFVFEYKERRLLLRFAVRRDAVPVYPATGGDA